MRLKLDENITIALKPLLAAAGHEVHSVIDEGMQGTDDEHLFAAC